MRRIQRESEQLRYFVHIQLKSLQNIPRPLRKGELQKADLRVRKWSLKQ